MKKEQFYETLGDIDDKMVKEADKPAQVRPKTWRYIAAAAACLVLCAGVGAAVMKLNRQKLPPETLTIVEDSAASSQESAADSAQSKADSSAETTAQPAQQTETVDVEPPAAGKSCKVLAEAVYPDLPKYPDAPIGFDDADWEKFNDENEKWWNAYRDLHDQPDGFDKGMDSFFKTSVGTLMTEQNGENKVYSPVSLYMALGMCSEITDGNTRAQILGLLGQDDIGEMRTHAKSVWQSVYKDDGVSACVLADSMWANEMIPCKQETADSLAENYYASAFSGDPTSEEYSEMFREWLDKQTDGLLSDAVKDMKIDPRSVITLASTVNFSGKWLNKFSKENNVTAAFHAVSGDKDCEFMRDDDATCYWHGDKFGSISMTLENNGYMRLILPDEGVSPEDLFADDEALKFMSEQSDWESGSYSIVHLTVPKFDVSAHIDLIDGLKKMGITDAFDSSISDFSPLTDEVKDIFISEAKQDSRVMIDEEGCRAAAITVVGGYGAGAPDEEVEFKLDRPFIFEIMSDSGVPLFVGVVNNPS